MYGHESANLADHALQQLIDPGPVLGTVEVRQFDELRLGGEHAVEAVVGDVASIGIFGDIGEVRAPHREQVIGVGEVVLDLGVIDSVALDPMIASLSLPPPVLRSSVTWIVWSTSSVGVANRIDW